jgi:hopanoid-associated phosphorylase
VGHVTILVATGLRREARLMAGPGVTVIAGGGDTARLERELEMLAGSAAAILSSGLAGALDPSLNVGDVVIGTECVVTADRSPAKAGVQQQPSDWALAFAGELNKKESEKSNLLGRKLERLLIGARAGLIAASNHPLAAAEMKAALFAETGALAVDMESHIAARVARRHGLPFAALRVISDPADATLPPAALAGMRPDGGIAVSAILGSLLQNPAQLPALIRTARDAEKAFRALGRVHDMLRCFGIGGLDPSKLALDMA